MLINNIEEKLENDIMKMFKRRNKIAHNLSSVCEFNVKTKENKIIFGGEETTWDDYLEKLKKWAELSYSMAHFTREIFSKLDTFHQAGFMYCKTEGECVLVQHQLLFPEPEEEYICFFKNGFDMDMLQYLKDEIDYNKGSDKNE